MDSSHLLPRLFFFCAGDYLLNLELHVSLPFTFHLQLGRFRSGPEARWILVSPTSPSCSLPRILVYTWTPSVILLREKFLIGRHIRRW